MTNQMGTARIRNPATYPTDLDFADDIVVLGFSIPNAQKLLGRLETAAVSVGLRMNENKTEYILVADWEIENRWLSESRVEC